MPGGAAQNVRVSPINVLYLAALENPASSALFTNQVLRLSREIVACADDVTMRLVVLYPVSLLRHRGSRRAMRELERAYAGGSLRVRTAPLPFSSRSFYLRRRQIPMFLRTGLHQLAASLDPPPHVLHCRSYPAAQLGLAARDSARTDAALVFDTRGVYPEEGVVMNRWTAGSPDHEAWRTFETRAFSAAAIVANVSVPHTELVRGRAPDARVETLPTVVDTAAYRDVDDREARRRELGFGARDAVLVFAGSFNAWRTAGALFAFYAGLRRDLDRPRLLILSNTPVDVAAWSGRADVPAAECAVRAVSPEAIPSWLSAADAGLLVEPRSRISPVTLGSKCGEYLAAGLPLIVSRHCGGAAAVVDAHGVGVALDTDEEGRPLASPSRETIRTLVLEARTRHAAHCRRVARDVFDVHTIASAWAAHYRRLAAS